jgi:hypothetical protein
MIHVVESISVAIGKTEQALEWMDRMVTHIEKAGLKVSGRKWWVVRPITGEASSRLRVVQQYASIAEWEEVLSKRRADSGYMALVKEMNESWLVRLDREIDSQIKEG